MGPTGMNIPDGALVASQFLDESAPRVGRQGSAWGSSFLTEPFLTVCWWLKQFLLRFPQFG